MKIKRLLIAISMVAMLLTLVANPVSASDSTYAATFRVHALGQGTVAVDDNNGGYYQADSQGNLHFSGKADAEGPEYMDGWEFYPLVPGTIKSHGTVTASWRHEGVRYSLQASIYATADTEGWVMPDDDFIVFGGSLPDPSPLEYTGKLWVGNQMTVIQGDCGVIAAIDPWTLSETYIAVVAFLIEDETILFVWADEQITTDFDSGVWMDIPEALVLQHKVTVVEQ